MFGLASKEVLAVRQGAQALDLMTPDWWKRIIGPINLSSGYHCVLGQVYGDYSEGLLRLGLNGSCHASAEHGFLVISGMDGWKMHQTWYQEIKARERYAAEAEKAEAKAKKEAEYILVA